MSISLQDIHEKQFHIRLRGFDIEEVDAFLEVIAESYSYLIDENKKMSAQIENMSQELGRVKSQESSFRNAIISAQKIADEMRIKSREEASSLLVKAHEEIKALKDEAHKEVTQLEARVEKLKGMQFQFEKEIRSVIASYLSQLDDIPKEARVETAALETKREKPAAAENLKDIKPDFSDLYEKIDLGDDLAPANMDADEEEKEEGEFPVDIFLGRDDEPTMPDLDSDVMFTLHDPLDDDETTIDVAIDPGKNER